MTTYPLPQVYRPDRWSMAVGAPAGEPVTLAEIKAHLYVEHTGDDDLITALGLAARQHVEDVTKRALVTQTRVLRLSGFPIGGDQVIMLPGGNIQSVTSVAYTDEDGASQTLAGSVYAFETSTDGGTGLLSLKYGQEWPDTQSRGLPVVVTYVAGWDDDAASPPDYGANVPAAIKTAIKMIVAGLYEQRQSDGEKRIYSNPAVAMLLSPWVVHRFA